MLVIVMLFLVYVAIHHKKYFPRVRNPEELRARLAGEYEASSDEDISVAGYSDISDIDEDLALAEIYHEQKREDEILGSIAHEEALETPLEANIDALKPSKKHEKTM